MLQAKHGSFAAINRIIGRPVTDSTLSQIANRSTGSKTDKPKTMGSPQARLIENELNLERGWMDTDPDRLAPGEQHTNDQPSSTKLTDKGDAAHHPLATSPAQAMAALSSRVEGLAPILQGLGRDCLIRWAKGEASLAETAITLDALAKASPMLPQSAAISETPVKVKTNES